MKHKAETLSLSPINHIPLVYGFKKNNSLQFDRNSEMDWIIGLTLLIVFGLEVRVMVIRSSLKYPAPAKLGSPDWSKKAE